MRCLLKLLIQVKIIISCLAFSSSSFTLKTCDTSRFRISHPCFTSPYHKGYPSSQYLKGKYNLRYQVRESSLFSGGVKNESSEVSKAVPNSLPQNLINEIPSMEYDGSKVIISEENSQNDLDKASILVLLTVPLAWGTYAPVVKYVYDLDTPLPGLLFSAVYYMIAALTLVSLNKYMGHVMSNPNSFQNSDDTIATMKNQDQLYKEINTESNANNETTTSLIQLQAGLELGSYLFMGNCLQVIGLKTVPADRAAFLVQLTTIMVPIIQAIMNQSIMVIPVNTWLACLVAFVGVVVMGIDENTVVGAFSSIMHDISLDSLVDLRNSIQIGEGDGFIVLSAFVYTMHVIRLGRYAKFTSPLKLASTKACVEATLSTVLVLLLLWSSNNAITAETNSSIASIWYETSGEIHNYFSTIQQQNTFSFTKTDEWISNIELWKAFGACLWTGMITCAYTIYAQAFGQSRVTATNANLIYTTQPIFSAFFAWILLHESLSLTGWVGGGLIGFSLWLVSLKPNN